MDVCLFDKTGTITSDRLLAETLVAPQPLHPSGPPVTVKLGRSARGGRKSVASERVGETVGRARVGLAAEVKRCQNAAVGDLAGFVQHVFECGRS